MSLLAAVLAITLRGVVLKHPPPVVPDYERLMVPIVANDAPGAFGSRWTSETWLANDGSTPAPFNAPACERPEVTEFCFGPLPVNPGAAVRVLAYAPVSIPAAFIDVPRSLDATVALHSRMQDTSRQAQTWGTEIPIVREDDFASRVTLLDVPTDARFRVMLRTYGSDDSATPVRVRVYALTGQEPLLDVARTLAPSPSAGRGFPQWPAYDQIALLDAWPQLAATDTLRITIDSLDASKKVWAFASVTNNETQHVTVIAPR